MAIIAHFSTHGAPGVTMSTVALALQWPRPVVLVEADPAAPSAVLPGFMRGAVKYERNMTELAKSFDAFGLTSETFFHQLIPLAQDPARFAGDARYRKHLLPAFPSPRAATGHESFWNNLLISARAFEKTTGSDIFLDLGRITTREKHRMILLTGADLVVAHFSATLVDAWSSQENITRIHQALEEQGNPDALCAVTHQNPAVDFTNDELSLLIPDAPILTRLPFSQEASAIFSHGADIPASPKKLEKKLASYQKSIGVYSAKLQGRLEHTLPTTR